MSEDYSGALKVAAEALAKEVLDLGGEAYDGELSEAVLSDATAIVKALAAAGLLLPEGAERRTEVMILWASRGYLHENWGADSLEHARKAAACPPEWAVAGQIVQRDHLTTPWSAVEPVAIQGDCGDPVHGGDGGSCPSCGFNINTPVPPVAAVVEPITQQIQDRNEERNGSRHVA